MMVRVRIQGVLCKQKRPERKGADREDIRGLRRARGLKEVKEEAYNRRPRMELARLTLPGQNRGTQMPPEILEQLQDI